MRSVPRISYDMNLINRPEAKQELFLEEHNSKTSFFATRRDFLYTTFIEDPQLVLKRQKELEEENLNKIEDKQNQNILPQPPETEPPPPKTTETTTTQNTISKQSPPKINKKKKIQKETPKRELHSIKKMTKYEIDNIVDRLTSTSDNIYSIRNHRNNNSDREKPLIRRKNTNIDGDNDAVFERLYIESTQQKTENKKDDDVYKSRNPPIPESDTEILSKSIALQKIKEMIDASFPEKQGITLNELNDIFIRLGILEHCEKIEKIPQISYIIEKWKVRNTELYDTNIIKDVLVQSIIGRKGKFKHFARDRMFSALANRKNNENAKINQQYYYSSQVENQVNHSKCLTQETFDRLLSPRPIFSPPKNEEEEDFSNIRLELSAETQKILKKSEYGNVKLEERDKILAERAMAKIEDIRYQMEKERLKMQKKRHASKLHITPEERAKIDELKQKRQNDIENEKPTYKPDVMKYSDFLHLKESMKEEKEKPPGLDAFLGRMKKGYEQYQKKKFDEENIRSLPQLPSKKRAASEIKKKKKEKQPEPQEMIDETPPPPVENIAEINKSLKNDKKDTKNDKNDKKDSKKQQETIKNKKQQKTTNNKTQKSSNAARSQKTTK